MPKGTIRKLVTDRGFGFIKTEQEEDAFFHRNELQGVEFSSLKEGQEVEFDMGQGRDGRPAAVKGRPIETQASDASEDNEGGEVQGGGEDGG